jgi:alkylation response protein AidB-like acyl-CoA dehydrogenase
MNFQVSDEQRAIRETAADLLAARGSGDGLWAELCELGWPGIAISEEGGGQGLGVFELAILVEELGYACASTPFLGSALAGLAIEHAGSAHQIEHWLPLLASGDRLGALALADEPALIPDALPEGVTVVVERATGAGTIFDGGAVEAVEAIDPGRRHGVLRSLLPGEPMAGDAREAVDRAAVVVAAELVGLCRRALEETVAYVKDRHQFGVPIGSFQAVQHTAAQMLRETESASVLVQSAAWIADNDPGELAPAAAMAKASAAEAGKFVTAAAIQLHGGIGFTWEADLHWLFKRAQVDAAFLGGGGFHYAVLARELASQSAPA